MSSCAFLELVGGVEQVCGRPAVRLERWQGNSRVVVVVPLCAEHQELSGRLVIPARIAARMEATSRARGIRVERALD